MLLVALGGLVMAAEGFGREAAEHPSPKHVHAQGSAQRCRHCPLCHPFGLSALIWDSSDCEPRG